MFRRFDDIFAACGWRVVTLKYGKAMEAAFAEPGGDALKGWIDEVGNADYAALTYLGGAAWRERLLAEAPDTRPILDARDDEALAALMTNLAGHDMASLVEAFDAAQDDVPTLFIAYTVKGQGLPFAGHKDNHAGLMNPARSPRCASGWASRRARSGSLMPDLAAMRRRRCAPWSRIAPLRGPSGSGPGMSRRCPQLPRLRARSNRPRRLSGRSCSIWPRPAARSPIASSPRRPT
jgi:hypothetical protein